MSMRDELQGDRFELTPTDAWYPSSLRHIRKPPEKLYGIGDKSALESGLAIIGARKATPYGRSCARRFSRIAAAKGVCIISGGARGCDSEAHRAALDTEGKTVVFLGGGCDRLYPHEHFELFQRVIDRGGAVVSEHFWDCEPKPYMFRERNRLIAGLAAAVLIVEAGLPSGTFSTADDALSMGKEVLVVPGAITSPASRGSNRLLYQGAIPIVDDESFEDALFTAVGALRQKPALSKERSKDENPLLAAVFAEPLGFEDLYQLSKKHYHENARAKLSEALAEAEADGLVARQADGKWGPIA